MDICKDCKTNFKGKNYMFCPNCGATYCEPCGKKSKNICPNCYASLELR